MVSSWLSSVATLSQMRTLNASGMLERLNVEKKHMYKYTRPVLISCYCSCSKSTNTLQRATIQPAAQLYLVSK